MDNLETYNRVSSLERPLPKTLLLSVYTLLFFTIIMGAINFAVSAIDQPVLDYISIAALIAYILIYIIDGHRHRYCQHCGDRLTRITRPFLLTSKFLSMEGRKQGDYFYTRSRRHLWSLTPRWTKISQQSLACHHCRLTEEKQTESYEAASEAEIAQLSANTP
ncbi:hypothetical protein [Oceanicoccus sagamiensis]|uniref:Uncharacterized protein n=1 Tax=Oceanicoccus sagamiensis TaxID=716816 RepID=A0A1X9NEI2_9GAMM|nr:hypothetical protein [Oceanicoccus sagamiensis]ARN75464.1 hypothetical protein BST96_15910 [Oceanicoccus sagamiensis]